jgi:hypothetical protein
MLGAAALGLGIGAVMAGAPAYLLLAAGAGALTASAITVLVAHVNRGEIRKTLIEVCKLELMQKMHNTEEQVLDLDDVRAVPVTLGTTEAIAGVTNDTPIAEATVLRFAVNRARRGDGVAS